MNVRDEIRVRFSEEFRDGTGASDSRPRRARRDRLITVSYYFNTNILISNKISRYRALLQRDGLRDINNASFV